MGSRKEPKLDQVVYLKEIRRGMFICHCKYNPHIWDGGPIIIKLHLLSLKGYGATPCLDALDLIKDNLGDYMCAQMHPHLSSKMANRRMTPQLDLLPRYLDVLSMADNDSPP